MLDLRKPLASGGGNYCATSQSRDRRVLRGSASEMQSTVETTQKVFSFAGSVSWSIKLRLAPDSPSSQKTTRSFDMHSQNDGEIYYPRNWRPDFSRLSHAFSPPKPGQYGKRFTTQRFHHNQTSVPEALGTFNAKVALSIRLFFKMVAVGGNKTTS